MTSALPPGTAHTPSGKAWRRKDAVRQQLGPISITCRHPHHPLPVTITVDPADAGSADSVARDLANAWAKRYRSGSFGTAYTQSCVLKILFESLAQAGVASWIDVTVELLRTIEDDFATTHYHPGLAWEVMRQLPKGSLQQEVHQFVQSPPSVKRHPTVATEALPQGMLRDVLRQAMRDVTSAESRIAKAAWDGTSSPPEEALIRRHESQAFFVLLCMEWTMSPDVIASLSFDPREPTSVQNWHDGEPKVTLQWFKRRGKTGRGVVMLADKPWRAGSLLRRLRDATEATRYLGGAKWKDAPWVCVHPVTAWSFAQLSASDREDIRDGYGLAGVRLVSAHRQSSNENTFRAWCQYERQDGSTVEIDPRYEDARLPYRAIRPAAKWARFVATGGGLLLQELVDDNTVETLSAHYLNSAVAMRDIAESFMVIPNLAEEVARGLRPTLVDRDGAVISGRPLPSADIETAVTDNRVGVSGCLDPRNSPITGESKGRLCGQANRACFSCPNSVVTPDDVPALVAFLGLAERAKVSLSPPEWELHWGLTVRWVRFALPLLHPNWADLPVDTGHMEAMFDLGLQAGPA